MRDNWVRLELGYELGRCNLRIDYSKLEMWVLKSIGWVLIDIWKVELVGVGFDLKWLEEEKLSIIKFLFGSMDK